MEQNNRRFEAFGFLIMLVTFVAFLPSLNNGFINYDDPLYVMENQFVRDFSLSKIPEIFNSRSMNIYNPLVTISFAFDYWMGGGKPQFFHFHNLMLHILTTILIFRFISVWTKSLFIAFWSAVFFGVHPLHVESVAWIAERKDVLSGALLVGAMNLWLEYRMRKGWAAYFGVWVLLSLSLLVKPVGIMFPLLACCLDCSSEGERRSWPKPDVLAFFLLVLPVVYFAAGHQSLGEKLDKLALPCSQYVFIGVRNFNWYIEKAFIPTGLSIFYPMSELQTTTFAKEILIFTIVVGCVLGACARLPNRLRVGLIIFILFQVPYLKFVPFGNDFICADRYFYLSSMGLFLFLTGLAEAAGAACKSRKMLNAVTTAFICVTLVFSNMTWNRCKVWQNSETLWRDAVTKYPDSADSWNNLGVALINKSDSFTREATDCFRKAYDLDPSMKIAKDNLDKFLKELD